MFLIHFVGEGSMNNRIVWLRKNIAGYSGVFGRVWTTLQSILMHAT